MEKKKPAADSVEAYRAAYWEAEALYGLCAKQCGLSEMEYWILLALHEGVETQSAISDRIGASRQTVNSACKVLVKKGLIAMEALETNLRVKRISLTEDGWRFMHSHLERVFRLEAEVWNRMPQAERAALVSLTAKYNALMKAALLQEE